MSVLMPDYPLGKSKLYNPIRLVLDGNPLEDIHNVAFDKMDVIMKEGQFVKRKLFV